MSTKQRVSSSSAEIGRLRKKVTQLQRERRRILSGTGFANHIIATLLLRQGGSVRLSKREMLKIPRLAKVLFKDGRTEDEFIAHLDLHPQSGDLSNDR